VVYEETVIVTETGGDVFVVYKVVVFPKGPVGCGGGGGGGGMFVLVGGGCGGPVFVGGGGI
jgi:hypothetical protein